MTIFNHPGQWDTIAGVTVLTFIFYHFLEAICDKYQFPGNSVRDKIYAGLFVFTGFVLVSWAVSKMFLLAT